MVASLGNAELSLLESEVRTQRPESTAFDPVDERVRKLEQELESARRTIIRLAPIEYQDTLRSFYECKSTRDFWRWEDLAAEKIANQVPEEVMAESFGTRRADCPLCGRSTMGPYAEGFVVPGGLIRHLTGFGNTRQCPVMEAASQLGRNYVEREYGSAERAAQEAEDIEKARVIAARRTTETQYRIHPFSPPELVDEGYRSWFGTCRAAEKLAWAEARVIALGFSRHLEGNVLSLTLERDDHIIFADIRDEKKVTFHIFKSPPKKSKRLKSGSFDLLDSVKHDLQTKFDERLATALLLF